MPPKRGSPPLTGRSRLNPRSQPMSSSPGSGDQSSSQRAEAHSLPTHSLRRIVSLDSIEEDENQDNADASVEPTSTISDSGSSSDNEDKQIKTAIAASLTQQVGPAIMGASSSQNTSANRQILRQGRTYVPPSTANGPSMSLSSPNQAGPSRGYPLLGTNGGASMTSSGLPNAGNQRVSFRLDENNLRPTFGARPRNKGRFSRGGTFRLEHQDQVPQPQSHKQPHNQLLSQRPSRTFYPRVHSSRHNFLKPSRFRMSAKMPSALRYQSKKRVVDPVDEKELEGLEVVGLDHHECPNTGSSSNSSTSGEKSIALPAHAHAHAQIGETETGVILRQTDLPVAIIPHTSMELERCNLITKMDQQFVPRQGGPLAIEYHHLDDDDEDAWTDEEPWHCSDDEQGYYEEEDDDDDEEEEDSDDSDEDFGCIGLLHDDYEDMLKAGKGFNQELVEEVDNWPAPEEVKILGYRVIGRLGKEGEGEEEEEEDDDEDEDEDEEDDDDDDDDDEEEDEDEEGEIWGSFGDNEDYQALRKHRWLDGLSPIQEEDDEWEDDGGSGKEG
ncbi:hypothetical protein TWF730_005633 [Orbilia blumenaviensis]|uniref:Transcription factor Iwr1 domain-containing protein n=1 Tax=Orbilia blumenaviensis TaxID=1796055 RepID=A0AAV9VL75_9PEZI